MSDGVDKFVLAMGSAPAPGVNPYVQLIPIALVFAIFYFIILLPTKRKQKKLEEFLAALKVGDRVVTTGGIYGSIAKLGEQSVQLQVANNVKIEVARSAIGGYQGQDPLAEGHSWSLRTKIIIIIVTFVVFFGLGVYPIAASRYGLPAPGWLMAHQLKLGLDLRGGVHLVLRVQTDDALSVETEQEMSRVQQELKTRDVPATATLVDATHFKVDGVPPAQDQAFRQAATQEAVNFDRSSGVNGSYTFSMKPNIVVTLREEAVTQARQTIERRVNELGVTEPSIAQQGADQILVQLPGVTDVDRAKEIIGSPGMLELKLVEQGPAATKDDLLRATGGQVPPDMEVLSGAPDPAAGRAGPPSFYLVRRVAAVTGHDLRSARPELDENNQPAVGFTLNRNGAAAFSRITGENIGRHLAIVLDKTVQSAPRIESRINDQGRINGSFTQEEAQNLSLILRSGALPATLTYPRRAHDRAEPRRPGFDPVGRAGLGHRPAVDHRVHSVYCNCSA